MKILVAICMLVVASACASATQSQENLIPLRDIPMPPVEGRFPVSHDAAAIAKAYAHPTEADGENASVEGEVVSVRKLKNGLPAVTIRIAPATEILLLHSTPIEQGQFLEIGMRLRSMGYLRKTPDLVALLGRGAGSDNPLSLMSLCIVQSRTLAGAFDQNYIELCAAWQKGQRLGRLK